MKRHLSIYLKCMVIAHTIRDSGLNFIDMYKSIFKLFPGLHPDEYDNPDGGWPEELKPWAKRAFELHKQGLISDEDLYPADVALKTLTEKRS